LADLYTSAERLRDDGDSGRESPLLRGDLAATMAVAAAAAAAAAAGEYADPAPKMGWLEAVAPGQQG
jgi:hypothetical protein